MKKDSLADDVKAIAPAATLWDQTKKRFQDSIVGVLILGGLAVAVFLGSALGAWDTLVARFRPPVPHLKVPPLSGTNAPKPLDGYSIIQVVAGVQQADGPTAVYPRGATIQLDVSHSHDVDASLTLRELELHVDKFVPGRQDRYTYKVRGDQIIGAGPVTPYIFHVALFGNRVGKAMYIKDPNAVANPMARSANFLDTEEPLLYALSKTDDAKSVNVVVTAENAGLYQISFSFTYVTLGRSQQVKTSPPVFIYYDGN